MYTAGRRLVEQQSGHLSALVAAAVLLLGCNNPEASSFEENPADSGCISVDAGVDSGECDAGPHFDGWRFAVFGDSRGTSDTGGHNAAVLSRIAAAVVEESVEFVIFPGDLVYGSDDSEVLQAELTAWLDTMEVLYEAGIGVYPIRGNHDDGSLAAWNKAFSGAYALPNTGPQGEENLTYAVEHENALILGFDVLVNAHRVNQSWLDEQLEAATAEHIFAFGHEPAYHAVHEDCLDDYPEERDTFWNSLAAAGARVYFACHDHFFGRALVRDGDAYPDMYQMIVATAGAPPYEFDGNYDGDNGDASVENVFQDTPNGYVIVEIDGPRAKISWKKMISTGVFEEADSFCYDLAKK